MNNIHSTTTSDVSADQLPAIHRQNINHATSHQTTDTIQTENHTTTKSKSRRNSKKIKSRKKIIIDENRGDDITKKPTNALRFLYQNINGMKDIADGKWLEAVEKMKDMEVDIVGIGEPCINWRLKLIKQQYLQPLLSTFKNSSLIVSTIQTTHDKLYLPGGTATVTIRFWNSKISKQTL
jgi:hypothetical protein